MVKPRILLLGIVFLFDFGCTSQPVAPPVADSGPADGRELGLASDAGQTDGLAAAKPTVTFVVNTHDWYNIDHSAQTLHRLMDLFAKYQIRGEFYFTEGVFRICEDKHPDVLQRMLAEKMTISFHMRVPHPVTFGGAKQKELDALPHDQLVAELKKYETFALDLTTGGLTTDEGGYAYMKKKIGYAPPVAGLNAKTKNPEDAELEVLQGMGLQMYVRHHTGDQLQMTKWGVLARPSEFNIGQLETGFWTESETPLDPATLFQGAAGYGVVLVHEHDFYAPKVGWSQVYSTSDGKIKPPPWDLNATNPDYVFHTDAHAEQIWANYEGFVAYAVKNFNVVTSLEVIQAF